MSTKRTYAFRPGGGAAGSGGGFSTGVYVDAAGNDTSGERGNPLKPFLTLSAALAASSSGDTIFVGPGTFSGAFTWLDNRALQGSGVGATVLGNMTYTPTGSSNVFTSWQDCTMGTVTVDATGKSGFGILRMRANNLYTGAVSITGRTNGYDRIMAEMWDVNSTSFTLTNVIGVLYDVKPDANLNVTVPVSQTLRLVGCACDTLGVSGGGSCFIVGGSYAYFSSNDAGARYAAGTTFTNNVSINSTSSLRTSGCFVGGTVSRASGATWINSGSVLATNNIEFVGGAGLILTHAYNFGTIVCTADNTITLPAPHAGLRYTIKPEPGVTTTVARGSANIENEALDDILTGGQSVMYIADGTEWWKIAGVNPNVQIFTEDGTWTRPRGCKFVTVVAIGAGGGGGGGRSGLKDTVRAGGGGGGGGARSERTFTAADLGDTVAVTVGVGGSGGSGGAQVGGDGGDGGNGGNSAFGSFMTAFGGGGGRRGTNGGGGGGGGGGTGSAGGLAGAGAGSGGTPGATNSTTALGGQGAYGGNNGTGGGQAEWGGGGGGGRDGTPVNGTAGSSLHGGPGGGCGAGITAANAAVAATAGGAANSYVAGGGGAIGSSGATATAGTAGASSDANCGNGGGGGGAATTTGNSGGNGGDGGVAGAGGGGGGAGTTDDVAGGGGNGGEGGRGEVRVYCW